MDTVVKGKSPSFCRDRNPQSPSQLVVVVVVVVVVVAAAAAAAVVAARQPGYITVATFYR
jgi:hypothetical protein